MKKVSTRKKKPSRSTAIHEAGHAVIARHLGIGFRYVTVQPSEDALGHMIRFPSFTGENSPEWDSSPQVQRKLENLTRAALAGFIAEKRVRPKAPRWVGQIDFNHAVEMLSYLASGNVLDTYLKLMRLQTEAMLANRLTWKWVEAVADALLCDEKLTGKQVQEIIFSTTQGIADSRR